MNQKAGLKAGIIGRIVGLAALVLAVVALASVATAAIPTPINPGPPPSDPNAFWWPVQKVILGLGYNWCCASGKYHTGIDFWDELDSGEGSDGPQEVLAAAPGTVALIQANDVGCNPDKPGDCDDHGLGNTVIIRHTLSDGRTVYSLYAHLKTIEDGISVGNPVSRGQRLGPMGCTSYGNSCLTSDGEFVNECVDGDRNNDYRFAGCVVHLHFEIKQSESAVLGDPGTPNGYYGYTPSHPDNWGYYNPGNYIPICSQTPISLGQTVSGALSTSDSRSPVRDSRWSYYCDRYTFSGAAGQQVAILLTSSAFDTYLYLIGPSGTVVTQNDDGGGGTNSRIPPSTGYYTLPSSGTYTIEVTSYYTNATGSYTLSLSGP